MCVCPPPSGRETTDNRSFCFAPRGVRSLTAALSPRGSKQNGGYPSFPGAGGRAHTHSLLALLPYFRPLNGVKEDREKRRHSGQSVPSSEFTNRS